MEITIIISLATLLFMIINLIIIAQKDHKKAMENLKELQKIRENLEELYKIKKNLKK